MRVTYVITGLGTGGAEMMLLKLLQSLDRSRFEPSVITLTDKGDIGPCIEALGIPVVALGMRRGMPNPLALFTLVRHLRRIKPDLVSTWMYHADLLGALAARLAGCRSVVWGLRHSNLSKADNKRSTLLVVKVCAALSSRLPTQILSCSMRGRTVHVSIGYKADKIHVIPNGFDLGRFRPDSPSRDSMRAELGLPLDTLLVGLIARYDPQKNHAGFVEVAAQVHSQLPQAHFVMAGAGVDRENDELRTIIDAHGLRGHMHLLGRRNDMPRLMAALDVLVSSSSHGEAFPNVLGEAMACAVPCVVTDVGDSAEIVGSAGRVTDAGDMVGLAKHLMDMLRLSPSERQALGEQARIRIAAEYEIGKVVDLYQCFYERLMTKGYRN